MAAAESTDPPLGLEPDDQDHRIKCRQFLFPLTQLCQMLQAVKSAEPAQED